MAKDEGPADQVSPRVVANVIELERLWRKHKLSADMAYQVLRDAVLPAARPDEVFLYASPLNVHTLRRPQSVGMLLAEWAVKAGKAGELKQAMIARKGPAMSALPLAILSAQLALAMNDPAAISEALKAIAARLKTDTSHHTSELACHVAIPGLFRPEAELAAVAIGVVDSAAKGMETANQPEPLASLLLILARRQFELGDAAGGRKRLDAYLAAMDKSTIRSAGDYPLLLRKQQLHRVAAELVRAACGPMRSTRSADSSTRRRTPAVIHRSTTCSLESCISSPPVRPASGMKSFAPGPCRPRTARSSGS